MSIAELRLEDLNGSRVMVLWSGGLDTTHLLHALLTRTDAAVSAHHVKFTPDLPNVAEAETAAVVALRQRLNDCCRAFEYSESQVDISAIAAPAPFLYSLAPMAALAARRACFGPADFILSGRNADEDQPVGSRYELNLRRMKASAVEAAFEFNPCPAFVALNPPPTRAEQRAELPADLLELVWSCFYPQPDDSAPTGWRPCGRCAQCDRPGFMARRPASIARTLRVANALHERAARLRSEAHPLPSPEPE